MKPYKTIRVILADDHHVFRNGVEMLLSSLKDIKIVAQAASGKELLEKLSSHPADVVLLDIDMPGLSGLEVMPMVKEKFPEIHVLVFTMHTDKHFIQKMMRNGALGFISKSVRSEEVEQAVRTVASGGTYLSSEISHTIFDLLTTNGNQHPRERKDIPLTEREVDVLKLVARGHTNFEIAEKLFISPRTVDTHRRNIMEKLDLHNAAALSHYAAKKKLLD